MELGRRQTVEVDFVANVGENPRFSDLAKHLWQDGKNPRCGLSLGYEIFRRGIIECNS
jgi:hypothetical protein